MTISMWQQTEDPRPISVEPVRNKDGKYEMPVELLREQAESDEYQTLAGNWIDPPEYMAVYVCGRCHNTKTSEDNPTRWDGWEVAYIDSIRAINDPTLWEFTIICSACVKFSNDREHALGYIKPTFCRGCGTVDSQDRIKAEHKAADFPLYYSTCYLARNIRVIDYCDNDEEDEA